MLSDTLQVPLSSNLYFFLVECALHPPTFFAKCLHKAMAGMGTDDTTLIRIIVSRSEIDLENIKIEYERLYEKTLESAVRVRKTCICITTIIFGYSLLNFKTNSHKFYYNF